MPLGFLFIPQGCLIIAQLFKVGSLGKSGLSPEGTTETVSSARQRDGYNQGWRRLVSIKVLKRPTR
jgi:hypothetical protein